MRTKVEKTRIKISSRVGLTGVDPALDLVVAAASMPKKARESFMLFLVDLLIIFATKQIVREIDVCVCMNESFHSFILERTKRLFNGFLTSKDSRVPVFRSTISGLSKLCLSSKVGVSGSTFSL